MEHENDLNIRSVLLVVFAVSLTTGVFSPLMPAIQREFNLSATMLTLILAVFGITRLLIDVPAGRLVGAYGAPLLLSIGTAAAMIGAFGAAIAPTYSFLLATRVLVGIGSALTVVIGLSVLARQMARPDAAMSYFYISMFTAMILGPVGSGLMEQYWGWRAPVAVIGVLTLIALVRVMGDVGRSGIRRLPSAPPGASETGPVKRTKPVLTIYWLSFVSLALYSGAKLALLPLFGANELDLSVTSLGVIFTLTALLTPLTMLATARVASPRIKVTLISAGLGVWVLGLGCLLIPSLTTFILASACFDLAGGLMYATPYALLTDCVPRSAIGKVMGEVRLPADVAWLIVPPLIGFGLDTGGPVPSVAALMALTVGSLIAVRVYLSRSRLEQALAFKLRTT